MDPLLDVCVREPIIDPLLDVCVRAPIMDPLLDVCVIRAQVNLKVKRVFRIQGK